MYKGFQLEGDSQLRKVVKEYSHVGEEMCSSKKKAIKKRIDDYVRGDDFIECTKLQKDWFPEVNVDVFISHSHNDIDLVNGLAGWLHEEMGISSFVDSYIWNYCDDLLHEIDEKYCRNSEEEFFDYNKRNYSTTHVHMMLANSLNKMIDKTECIIFLKTPNSVNAKNIIEQETNSAWIYSEIMTTSIIRKNIPNRLKVEYEEKQLYNLSESFNPAYKLDTNHLIKITLSDLIKVRDLVNYSKMEKVKTNYLDTLYKITYNRR